MFRKRTPIRYGQMQPVWNRRQGKEKEIPMQDNLQVGRYS
jgi:hypothetical protein